MNGTEDIEMNIKMANHGLLEKFFKKSIKEAKNG